MTFSWVPFYLKCFYLGFVSSKSSQKHKFRPGWDTKVTRVDPHWRGENISDFLLHQGQSKPSVWPQTVSIHLSDHTVGIRFARGGGQGQRKGCRGTIKQLGDGLEVNEEISREIKWQIRKTEWKREGANCAKQEGLKTFYWNKGKPEGTGAHREGKEPLKTHLVVTGRSESCNQKILGKDYRLRIQIPPISSLCRLSHKQSHSCTILKCKL